jgi:hypothetical protein
MFLTKKNAIPNHKKNNHSKALGGWDDNDAQDDQQTSTATSTAYNNPNERASKGNYFGNKNQGFTVHSPAPTTIDLLDGEGNYSQMGGGVSEK